MIPPHADARLLPHRLPQVWHDRPCDYISEHPDVFLPQRKEIAYFSRDLGGLMALDLPDDLANPER